MRDHHPTLVAQCNFFSSFIGVDSVSDRALRHDFFTELLHLKGERMLGSLVDLGWVMCEGIGSGDYKFQKGSDKRLSALITKTGITVI